jgi:cystathionine gamma-synthase
MVSFELKDGSPAAVDRFLLALRWFTLGESLGGVESLVAHPATMTHASMTPEARRQAGIGDDLIRLSVGLEDATELVHDLAQALAAATRAEAIAVEPEPLRAAEPCVGGRR